MKKSKYSWCDGSSIKIKTEQWNFLIFASFNELNTYSVEMLTNLRNTRKVGLKNHHRCVNSRCPFVNASPSWISLAAAASVALTRRRRTAGWTRPRTAWLTHGRSQFHFRFFCLSFFLSLPPFLSFSIPWSRECFRIASIYTATRASLRCFLLVQIILLVFWPTLVLDMFLCIIAEKVSLAISNKHFKSKSVIGFLFFQITIRRLLHLWFIEALLTWVLPL